MKLVKGASGLRIDGRTSEEGRWIDDGQMRNDRDQPAEMKVVKGTSGLWIDGRTPKEG